MKNESAQHILISEDDSVIHAAGISAWNVTISANWYRLLEELRRDILPDGRQNINMFAATTQPGKGLPRTKHNDIYRV
jgi:hypothetical protein